jgi:hypothetical protein
MKELILKTVDEADFFEIGADFAKNIICGFGRLDGQPVGVVANQPQVLAGVLDIDSSAARPPASSASATPSASRWSRSSTSPASCPAPSKSTAP